MLELFKEVLIVVLDAGASKWGGALLVSLLYDAKAVGGS
jgi:hypothetical protein